MSRARDLGSSINSNYAGKNLVVNGGFDFWQRTATPETSAHSTAGGYIADRWCPHQFQEGRISRTTIPVGSGPSSQYAIRVSSSTVASVSYGTRMVTSQKIESLNVIPLRGKRVTLSFWIRFSNSNFASSANSTDSTYSAFGYMIGYHTTTTDAPTFSTALDSQTSFDLANNNSSGSLPTSWTKMEISSTVPNNANNILVRFGFGALGSSATMDQYWYEVSDVQLEQGSTATPFSRAGGDIQGELAKCQRYFQSSFPTGTAPANNVATGMIFAQIPGNGMSHGFMFPVPMRATPSFATYNPYANNSNWRIAFSATDVTPTVNHMGNLGIYTGTTTGFSATLAQAVHGHWAAAAEL